MSTIVDAATREVVGFAYYHHTVDVQTTAIYPTSAEAWEAREGERDAYRDCSCEPAYPTSVMVCDTLEPDRKGVARTACLKCMALEPQPFDLSDIGL